MNLDDFKKIVPKIKENNVKGFDVQCKLAPPGRINNLTIDEVKSFRNAGVMALVYPKGQIMHLALILRTEYNGSHSGQVALPGGKQEEIDDSHWHTAIREVEEEIGISNLDIEFIKELTPLYVPVSKFKVYPFLAEAKKELTFILQVSEVKDLIEMPLSYFIFNSEIQCVRVNLSSVITIKAPAFVFENHIIWGATAMILNELKVLFVDSMDL